MLYDITLENKKISYELVSKPFSRSIRLAIKEGRLHITKPSLLSRARTEKFIISKSDWVLKKIAAWEKLRPIVPASLTEHELKKYKEKALLIAKKRLAYWQSIKPWRFNVVSIRDQSSRWGSCSKKRNLNFNWRLALLPEALADYLVVHEFCHLQEFNHSARFWKLVAELLPDYQERRRRLRGFRIN